MAREFPAGVVRTTDRFAAELGQFNGVNLDDIVRLWKAYTTQRTVVQDVVVSRLENLFWRIWGNGGLQQRLTGITLARIFMAIHENSSLHNNTLRLQSLSENVSPSVISAPSMAEPSLTITAIAPRSNEGKESSKKEAKTPLPPILKKSTEGKKSQPPTAPSSFKTTRIVVPEKPGQKRTRETAAENGKAIATATQKPTRKKAAFVANRATSSRRRGVLIRRKSTQTSPVQSPPVEPSEESLQEQLIKPKEEQLEENTQKSESFSIPKGPELSWRSLSYLKVDGDKPAPPEHEATGSPPPTNFSLSSVRHHRSPESVQASCQETTHSVAKSSTPLVDQDFRTNFVQRKRQESAHGTNNNSTASSLTTSLSSTNFRELLNAAGAAARSLPNHDGPSTTAGSAVTLTRKPDSKDRNRRPMIINTQLDTESVPHQRTAAVVVSESSTSTSQQTTSGVFSVPKESQGQLGEQLNSLIKGSKKMKN